MRAPRWWPARRPEPVELFLVDGEVLPAHAAVGRLSRLHKAAEDQAAGLAEEAKALRLEVSALGAGRDELQQQLLDARADTARAGRLLAAERARAVVAEGLVLDLDGTVYEDDTRVTVDCVAFDALIAWWHRIQAKIPATRA